MSSCGLDEPNGSAGRPALSDGTVIIGATVPVPYRDEEDEKIPSVFSNTYREGCAPGAMSFVGRWNEDRKDYGWTASEAVFLPGRVSTRGLVELDFSELDNGNLLPIMRGSNTGLGVREAAAEADQTFGAEETAPPTKTKLAPPYGFRGGQVGPAISGPQGGDRARGGEAGASKACVSPVWRSVALRLRSHQPWQRP